MEHIFANQLFAYFCLNPSASANLRTLAKETGLSHTQIRRLSKPLKKEGLLIAKKVGKSVLLSANTSNERFFTYKKWKNIYLLIEEGMIDELERHNPRSAILFGSFARGHDDEKSDIDVAVDKKYPFNLSKIEKKLQREFSLHIISEMRDTLLQNVRQGVLLWGIMP